MAKITRSELATIIKNTETKIGYKLSQSDINKIVVGMAKADVLKTSTVKRKAARKR